MEDFEKWLSELLDSPHVRMRMIDQVPPRPGLAVLWRDEPRQCLYVGIAGRRREEGLPARLDLLYRNNPGNASLAKHMQRDTALGDEAGCDFSLQQERQRFLVDCCFFQVITFREIDRDRLESFRTWVIERLHPRYHGREAAGGSIGEAAQSETSGRGISRQRIRRFVNALMQGTAADPKDRPADAAAASKWIRYCRRSELFDWGIVIYERGGFNFAGMGEQAQMEVEEDYQVCVRRSGGATQSL